jgi:hypothetical protein
MRMLTILQHSTVRYFDPLSDLCVDDHCTPDGDVPAEMDVSDNREMVEIPHMGGLCKASAEVVDL